VEDLLQAIPLQPHGTSSSLELLLVGVSPKVLQLGLFHSLLLQRWRFLQHHLLQINVLLQVQQPQPLLWPRLSLHVVENLCATSAIVMDMFLPNVQVGGP
jgi:hypothetical protein